MFTIEKCRNDYGVNIIGDFWEFDRLYYAISKYTGDFGLNSVCPYPDHKLVCQALLGLNYELRKTQQGERELCMQYNGLPSHWFENPEESNAIELELAKEEYLEEIGFFDDMDDYDSFDCSDHIDWESDEVQDALLNFDESSVEYTPSNGFAYINYPAAQKENTLLKLHLTFSELLYYAFILEELLSMKEIFFAQKKEEAETENPMIGLAEMYYYSGAQLDIDRLTYFKNLVFSEVYRTIEKDAYVMHLLPLIHTKGIIHDNNLKSWTEITEKYSAMEGENPEEVYLNGYLNDLKQIMIE